MIDKIKVAAYYFLVVALPTYWGLATGSVPIAVAYFVGMNLVLHARVLFDKKRTAA